MAGVNKVILLGNLGADPEMKYLENGGVIARINLATSETYTRNGERITHTEWHRVELWDNLAKTAEQYLKKGDTAYIEGKIRTEEWQDKEGNNRTGIRIRASNLTLVAGRRTNEDNRMATTTEALDEPGKVNIPSQVIPSPLPNEFQDDQAGELPF
jgi:single-strand DNA-binding protein